MRFWMLTPEGPEPCSPEEWERSNLDFDLLGGRIGDDIVDKVRISTSFTGIDHRLDTRDQPALWTTFIFGATSQLAEHYATTAAALVGHRRWVELVQSQADVK